MNRGGSIEASAEVMSAEVPQWPAQKIVVLAFYCSMLLWTIARHVQKMTKTALKNGLGAFLRIACGAWSILDMFVMVLACYQIVQIAQLESELNNAFNILQGDIEARRLPPR